MPRVVVHFDARGNPAYYSDGGTVELLIVDERAPRDRVYRHGSHAVASGVIDAVLGEDRVGYLGDRPGVEAAIRAFLAGEPPPPRPQLTVVPSGDNRQ